MRLKSIASTMHKLTTSKKTSRMYSGSLLSCNVPAQDASLSSLFLSKIYILHRNTESSMFSILCRSVGKLKIGVSTLTGGVWASTKSHQRVNRREKTSRGLDTHVTYPSMLRRYEKRASFRNGSWHFAVWNECFDAPLHPRFAPINLRCVG